MGGRTEAVEEDEQVLVGAVRAGRVRKGDGDRGGRGRGLDARRVCGVQMLLGRHVVCRAEACARSLVAARAWEKRYSRRG